MDVVAGGADDRTDEKHRVIDVHRSVVELELVLGDHHGDEGRGVANQDED